MAENIEATVGATRVVGTRDGGVCRFAALPFARPPVGPLRFAPPQPAAWPAELDATRPGPVAPQLPSRLREAMGDFDAPQSEDCLHLTVWTPAPDRARRPVVVWLHGGAWQSGAGAIDWYAGAQLAARGDIVVVAPNYRLAALGWLYLPGETANVGLLDSEAAVDWVARHIDAFGGDPDRITLMGQSAGGLDIACLMARKPRFSRVILQSASLGRGLRDAATAADLSRLVLAAAGAANLDAARRLPVDALLRAQLDPAVNAALAAERAARSLFCPVADGEVLGADPRSALDDAPGRADVLVGSTRDEMAAFPGMGTDADSRARGEAIFGTPGRRWAEAAAAQGRAAWHYRFEHAPSARFGACHCIELPFVFGTFESFAGAPMLAGLHAEDAARLRDRMQAAWVAFIRGEAMPWAQVPATQVFA
ncbi:MAG: carboxylesterase family protein [Burkholderiales bacterium]|nr:carboxylesterase family protein [Burkholderiales bacterium]